MRILLLSILLLPPLGLRFDDCDTCAPAKVCKAHLKSDKAELQKLEEDLRSKDAEERMDALSRAAELTEGHANAPSQEVAKVLAAALEDDQLRVRRLAIELLCDGQHPEVSVKASVRMIKYFEKNMWTLVATLMGPKEEHGDVGQAMKLLETTMNAVGALRDDRIANALISILGAYPTEMRGEPVAMATTWSLLDFGTRSAVSAVIEQFGSRPEESRSKNIHSALEEFADEHELEGTPAFEGDLKREWEAWLKKHKRSLPKKLGK